ncbi:MAG: FKBP-type peptidyl-prolyl cis-trans isomerase [Bacteroidaceae bacterium]|jgi:FKBP-type peptidyl-prolyl cis-trans isomerase FklB|nr:FKBP-type peptidyl-prolyl cis-trans isomerase [Bacteroidales bacterium]OPZ49425.1 MAG: FKBP-type 22 kDa peptidyl-prolyl cis-trans isomerase [Bacteroidetes bacterium ADurb.BinA104]HBA13342.1 peptidylprolyl isomerase [Bacteroidales bacterium]
MKKIKVLALCVAVTTLFSCGGSSKPGKVVMNNAVDTVSYSIGMGRAVRAYKSQLMNAGIDSTVMKSFVKGFLDAAKNPDDAAQLAYCIGFEIGASEMTESYNGLSAQMFGTESGTTFNRANYLNGFVDGMLDNWKVMSFEEADETSNRLYQYFSDLQFVQNRTESDEFLAKKAQEEGVMKTESGLLYKVIKEGRGAKPTPENEVEVIYRGTLVSGTVFDDSEGETRRFRLGNVIPGWVEGLQLMSAGSKYEFYIPYDLAYGDRNNGVIPPFSTLIFEVELVSFR